MDTKSIFASKTLWLNILGPVFTILATYGLSLTPDQQLAAVTLVMAIANGLMRLVTKQPVHIVAPPAVVIILAIALAGTLSACANNTAPPAGAPSLASAISPAAAPSDPLAGLRSFTLSDLQAASADAKANSDQTAAQCYDFLAANLPSLPGFRPGLSVGAILAFQKGRDLVSGATQQSGFLKSLNLACAPLVNDVNFTLAKLGLIAGGTAATGGALAPLAAGLPMIGGALPIGLGTP